MQTVAASNPEDPSSTGQPDGQASESAAEPSADAGSDNPGDGAETSVENPSGDEDDISGGDSAWAGAAAEPEPPAAEAEASGVSEASADEATTQKGAAKPDSTSVATNKRPIVGKTSDDGVSVSVRAPEGSFPEGTTLSISPLGDSGAAHLLSRAGSSTGFDITFTDASGSETQPYDGSSVSLVFSIDRESPLLPENCTGAGVCVYHMNDDGTVDSLNSYSTDSFPARIEVSASHFSEYGVIISPETPNNVSANEGPNRAGLRSATSTDLGQFLTGVSIDAPVDENGAYIINPNSTYEMTLEFAENEALQFDDENTLVYDFPEGVVVGDFGVTAFSLTVTDENGSAAILDNVFEVVDGQLRVRFNQDDPNFARLKAMPNVSFSISISSSFDENVGEIVFNANVVKDFVYEETSDLRIQKRVVYDMETDTASYELQIRSEGLNENVIIEDHLTGTALAFNQDVVAESSVNGTLAVTPDYASVVNGFRVTIPQTVDGEIITLRYSATVDNTKISSSGTVEQTSNTARVTSDQVPGGKEASADFAGQAKFQRVTKTASGDPVQVGDGLYEQTWTVLVNADHKMPMGGTYIYDWILQNSRPFMQFTGDGVTAKVTFENGETETRVLPWSELRLYTNSDGTYGWGYLTPESDGKASYEITCTTLINTAGALGDLTLANGAQVYNSWDEGTVTVGTIGESTFGIQKEAVGTTSAESEWRITVTVPGSGLPEMHIVDDCPKLTYDGGTYFDYPQEDSFEIEGLLEGESWRLRTGSDGRSFTITFYKSETQSDANKGLLPSPDGQPRDIVIRYKTTVDQDWLDLAADDGYASSTLYRHRNYACAWSDSYRTETVDATVIPIKPNLVKSFVERTDVKIGGVTYPVFRYSLALYGPTADGITIQDSFNTDYLKLYEATGIQILGGVNYTPTDGNGTVSAVDTSDGIDITVSSFPKQGDGSFYPYYEVSYSLIPKEQDALAALNAAAAASQKGIDLANTASWDDIQSSKTVNYTYFPYVDKELLARPTAENGYVAEFEVVINKYAEDLDPASDVLAIQDVLSANLRFIPDSLTISPASDSIVVQHDDETNTLTFTEVPDETTFTITYQARVLGSGNITYSNTIKFGNFEKTVEEEAVVESSGGGTGSNPSITIVKRDSENLSTTLAGATFQLFYIENGNQVPVQDGNGQDVTFTTGADGRGLIVGNLQSLGWTLWAGRTYCLVETAAPAGFETNEEPTYFVLTNNPSSQIEFDITGDQLSIQDEPVRISVPVTKIWVGPVGSESVTVHLLANGNDTGESIALTADNGWTGSFDNLRQYDDEGGEIQYSVEEDPIENYAPRCDGTASGGFTITNTNTETVDIPVSKQWVGPAAESATVSLLADGEAVDEASLSDENGWQHTFAGLPKYDRTDGHEIAYDVDEAPLEGYEKSVAGDTVDGYVITNTNVESTEVSGSKEWDDAEDQDGMRPSSITIRLLADGQEIASRTITAEDNWSWSFNELPRYDSADGHEITYSITEDAVEGYSATYSGFNVTNTHNPGKTSLTVTKRWDDSNDKDGIRPDSVTVRLLADGADTGRTIVLSAANNWTGSFAGLDEYKNGQRVSYTVSEQGVAGYTSSISGGMSRGFTVTNTHTPKDTPSSPGATPPGKSSLPKTGDSPAGLIIIVFIAILAASIAAFAASRRDL